MKAFFINSVENIKKNGFQTWIGNGATIFYIYVHSISEEVDLMISLYEAQRDIEVGLSAAGSFNCSATSLLRWCEWTGRPFPLLSRKMLIWIPTIACIARKWASILRDYHGEKWMTICRARLPICRAFGLIMVKNGCRFVGRNCGERLHSASARYGRPGCFVRYLAEK